MKLPLSKRLEACAAFVRLGDRVADVGCDHGYLGIHLLQNGIAASVIAADVRPMPLKTAMDNTARYGTAKKTEFCLSDGVEKIPRDFDVLVCAGMGADTIISILDAAPWLQDRRFRLILQCQTRTPLLRHYLSEKGWLISDEKVLRDGHFLYTVMEVKWQPDSSKLTPGQWFLSPALLQNADKELAEFYQYQCFRLQRIVEGRKEQTDPLITAALTELKAVAEQPQHKWLTEEKYDFSQRCT